MPSTGKKYKIGVDVGGTKMAAVLWDGKRTVQDYQLATPKDDLTHFTAILTALVEPLVERARTDKVRLVGVGLGVPGPIDFKAQQVLNPPNVPYLSGAFLPELLSAKLGLPVIMDNDANCFVLAEATAGAGKNYSNVFGITLGTGIGGGWYFSGDVYRGAHGAACEPGHMVIDNKSGMDLELSYQKLVQNNAEKLAGEAYRGDQLAERAFEEASQYLGVAMANIVNLFDPEAIIIGGSVAEASDLYLPGAKKVMQSLIVSPESKKVKVFVSKLGKSAGAIGAAMLEK